MWFSDGLIGNTCRMAKIEIKFLCLLGQNSVYSSSMWEFLFQAQIYKTWMLHWEEKSLSWLPGLETMAAATPWICPTTTTSKNYQQEEQMKHINYLCVHHYYWRQRTYIHRYRQEAGAHTHTHTPSNHM